MKIMSFHLMAGCVPTNTLTMKKLLLLIALSVSALVSHAQTNMEVADNYFAKKSYANASGYYNRVLTEDTANVKALRRMGFCAMNLPEDEINAVEYFSRALKIQPKDPVSNYYLGVIFMDKAKQSKDVSAKSDYKAKAALFLKRAISYGSEDAKAAQLDLNSI